MSGCAAFLAAALLLANAAEASECEAFATLVEILAPMPLEQRQTTVDRFIVAAQGRLDAIAIILRAFHFAGRGGQPREAWIQCRPV